MTCLGTKVNQLVNGTQNSGYKSLIWNATNTKGQPVSAGVYIYSIRAGDFKKTNKNDITKVELTLDDDSWVIKNNIALSLGYINLHLFSMGFLFDG